MLSDIRARLGTAQLVALLPTVIQHVELGGHTFLLETKLPGTTDQSPASGSAELAAAALPISDLHQTTSSVVSVDEALLGEWVDAPVAQLRRLSALDGSQSALDRLRDMLYDALLGQLVTISFVHGDYWLGNVLLDRDSDSVKVTGIADWENARAVGLPDCDLIHLWLTSQPEELGSTVRQAVLSPETVQDGVGQWAVSWSNPSCPRLIWSC
jgi:aminoglycoside phosphotransferase (APT) family kinase protein